MSSSNPRGPIDDAVHACFGLLLSAAALFVAVKLIAAVFLSLLVILGVGLFLLVAVAVIRARHRGW